MNALIQTASDTEHLLACPGCGAETIVVLQAADKHQIFLTSANEMFVLTGVCGCEKCGLAFLNPRMGQQKVFEYYAKQSRLPRETIEARSPFMVLMDIQIDEITKCKTFEPGMRVLEVGCAEGFFLHRLEERLGVRLDLYGVELSEKYLEQAKKLLPKATILETPLEQTEFAEVKFDLIVLRHVLEHLGSPIACLQKIRSILAPKGLVYIEVPDSSKTSPSVSRFYHHEHLLYFTTEVLRSYLGSAGLKPLVCERFEHNPIGSGFSYPVIRAIGTCDAAQPLGEYPGHARSIFLENKKREEQYLYTLLAPVRHTLQEQKEAQRTIGLFGAGPHTMDLLELLEVEGINWQKIFDNNPAKHGQRMRGIAIVKPDEITLNSVECILVSSAEFESEMVAQVRALTSDRVNVITIYKKNALC